MGVSGCCPAFGVVCVLLEAPPDADVCRSCTLAMIYVGFGLSYYPSLVWGVGYHAQGIYS